MSAPEIEAAMANARSVAFEEAGEFCKRWCPTDGVGRGLSQFYQKEFRARAQQARDPARQVRKAQKEAA